jgi:membrane protein implicated in regulation of membrane protease activity
MWILVAYILIVVVAELAVIAIGLVLDRTYPALSLTVSLPLFFAVLWLGWVFAVRVTEPKHAKSKKPGT